MNGLDKEKLAQKNYEDVINVLKAEGFSLKKGAQGQYGYTRESQDGSYTIWETVSFSNNSLYVYKQLNPWSPLQKKEIKLFDGVIGNTDRVLEILKETLLSI